jgi:aerobic carbon-monoxide dehydrogenase large subunit
MVHVARYLVVEDCGRMINPAVVDGQIRGGVAQGIGAVLFERFVYDDQGQPLSSTAPAALTNAIEGALAPFGVKIIDQHLPPARILELIETVGWRRGEPDR